MIKTLLKKTPHLSASVWASVGRSSRANEAKQPARLDKGFVLISVSGDSILDVFCETKKTGTWTNLSSVQLSCHSLLISDEELTRASELMSTEYAQNVYLVSNNWMNLWRASPGCSEGLLGAGKDSITGQNEPCGVSSPHINCKCFFTAPFPAANVAVEFS